VHHAHVAGIACPIAQELAPRAARGVCIFHDVILQALHFAPPDYHYLWQAASASWRRFSFG
jgi:hypothetical protein